MKRQFTVAALGALLLGAAATSPALAENATSPADQRAAALGEQIELANVPAPNGGVEWGRAEGVVAAKPEDVLTILHDYSQYAGLFPYFEKSKVLSQRGDDAIVYLEAKVLHGAATLWGQVRMTNKPSATHVIEAKLMKGKGNMSQLLARWEVTSIDAGRRSHVVFQLLVDPDFPMPDMVISNEMKKGAGQAFRALRKRAAERSAIVSRPARSM